ncbi:IS630 family transposase, partial [Pantoea stewartii subsp. stewartii]
VERLWQALHETITRNHQCSSMWQLLKKVHHFMNTVSPFPGGNMGWLKCSGIRISYLDMPMICPHEKIDMNWRSYWHLNNSLNYLEKRN